MEISPLLTAVTSAVIALVLYLYKLNRTWTSVPQDALDYSPHRWTDEEIRETYERVCREPIDFGKLLPPKLERRYIVVGGSGLLGGNIVLQLLMRGQAPSSIRIADLSPPSRPDLLEGSAAEVDFVKTDITDRSSVEAAFNKPWPSSVSKLPLTIFHTAAVIRPSERSLLVWDRTSPVNVDGTRNSLEAARQAGADIFVFTSSIAAGVRNCSFLVPPWARQPRRWVQLVGEGDFDAPLRPHGEFFANYAYSKALAERMVGEANGPGFRTGCVRPGNGIYGLPRDLVYADILAKGKVVTIGAKVIQNPVNVRNVSLAHLLFEAALAPRGEEEEEEGAGDVPRPLPRCAGRPLVVTDPGPAPQWEDFFRAVRLLAVTPLEVTAVPPMPMFLLAHAVEWWSLLLARFPFLTEKPFGFREPGGDLRHLQPGVFTAATGYIICVDDRARRSVAEGGLGYTGGTDTLEGVCELIRDWNREQQEGRHEGEKRGGKGGEKSILEADLVAKAVGA